MLGLHAVGAKAVAAVGGDAGAAFAALGTVTLSVPAVTATGAGSASAALATIALSAPAVAATAGASAVAALATLTLSAASASATGAAAALAALATVSLAVPQVIGAEHAPFPFYPQTWDTKTSRKGDLKSKYSPSGVRTHREFYASNKGGLTIFLELSKAQVDALEVYYLKYKTDFFDFTLQSGSSVMVCSFSGPPQYRLLQGSIWEAQVPLVEN